MTWEVVPEGEKPAVLEALKEGRCVACYGRIPAGHTGLYCCDCDDLCDHETCIAPPGNLCTETGCWDADRCVVDPICNERGVPQSECPPHCRHDHRQDST